MLHRLDELALLETGPPVEVKRFEQVGVETDRRLEFPLCFVIALAQGDGQSPSRMSLRQLGVQFEGLATRRVRLLQVGLRGIPVHVQEGATVGDPGMGERVARVDLDRSLEHPTRILNTSVPKLVEELAPAQVVVIGLHVGRRHLLDGSLLLVAQHDPKRPRSEEHTSELQSRENLVCRLLLEKKKHIAKKNEAAGSSLEEVIENIETDVPREHTPGAEPATGVLSQHPGVALESGSGLWLRVLT